MTAKLYSIAILVIAFAGMIDDCYDGAVSTVGDRSMQLSASNDPAVQAAGNSSDAVRTMRQAVGLRDYAVSRENLVKDKDMSFTEIDEAIEKMPGEPTFHTLRAAMLVAVGRDAEAQESKARALGIGQASSPDSATTAGQASWNYRQQYVASLIRIRSQLPYNSDGVKRVERQLCAQYRQGTSFTTANGVESLPQPESVSCN